MCSLEDSGKKGLSPKKSWSGPSEGEKGLGKGSDDRHERLVL